MSSFVRLSPRALLRRNGAAGLALEQDDLNLETIYEEGGDSGKLSLIRGTGLGLETSTTKKTQHCARYSYIALGSALINGHLAQW